MKKEERKETKATRRTRQILLAARAGYRVWGKRVIVAGGEPRSPA